MPIGGETIGRAYVKILADGDGFGDDIRKQLADSEGEWKAAGRNTAGAFKEGQEEEFKKWDKQIQRKQLERMNKSLGKWEQSGKWAGSKWGKGMQDYLHKKFGVIGDQMFSDMNEEIRTGRLDWSGLDKQLDNLAPRYAAAARKIRAEMERVRQEQEADATKAEKEEQRRGKERLARLKRNLDQQTAAETRWRQERSREIQAAFKEVEKQEAFSSKVRLATQRDMHNRLRALQKGARDEEVRHTGILMNNLRKLGNEVDEYSKRLIKTGGPQRAFRTQLVQLTEAMPDGVRRLASFQREVRNLSERIDPAGNSLSRFREQTVKSGNTVGKFFGAGSRNNFLNFFGGLVSMGPRVIGTFGKMTESMTGFFKEFKQVQDSEGLLAALGGTFKLLGKNAPGAIIAVGGALSSIGTILPMAGAAISGLAGIVLALAGALGFALVGAVVAVAGALVPLAAGLGVAALAFGGLQKMAKAAWMKDFKKDFEGLQKATAKEMFGDKGQNLQVFTGLLKTAKPLIIAVAGAIGDMITQFGKVAQSKGFSDMIGHLAKVLPPMIKTIGDIAGNLGTAFIGAFVAAEPYVTQFLGWLERVTQAMSDAGKGGGARGGSPLAQFFDKAVASAMRVWDLIVQVGKALSTLFSAGKSTGDNMITAMADQAEKLVTWMTSPAGQKALREWFDFAGRIAGKLGEIVLKAIEFIDALDTPASRRALEVTLDVIIMIGGWLVKAAGWMDVWTRAWLGFRDIVMGIGRAIGGFFSSIPGFFAAIPGFFSELGASIEENLGRGLDTLKQRGSEAAQGIQNAFSTVTGFFAGIGQSIASNLSTGLATIKQRLTELPGQIVSAFVSLPANIWTFVQQMIAPFVWLYNEVIGASIIPDLVNGIVMWFARLPGMISAVLGDLAGRFSIWLAGVPQKIQSSVGLVVGAFSGLAGKAIVRAGNIIKAFGTWVSGLPAKARQIATSVATGFTNLAGKIISKAGSLASRFAGWVSSLVGKARSTVAGIVNGFSNMSGKIISKAGSIASKFASYVAGLPGKAKTIAGQVASAFSGLAGKIIDKAGDLAGKLAGWGRSAVSKAGGVANDIVSKFSGLARRIVDAIGDIIPKIKMPSIKRPTVEAIVKVVKPKGAAAGGIFASPTIREIGEAGPEAVVPLARALNRVDPAVRALSAFAQGINQPGSSTGPSIGRQIDVGGITINTPTEDPRAVASEVVTRLTFAAYI